MDLQSIEVNLKQQMFQEQIISFENINYTLRKKGHISNHSIDRQRTILRNVDGYFRQGMNAILGSSGAGKTSLLNILAKRVGSSNNTELHGRILVNNKEYTSKDFSNFACYVMQDDLLLANLTVKEYLQFAADLRLDINKIQKFEKVQNIIKLLQLELCQNSLIGDHMKKGISGGEKKRTSIGLELIGEPSVLFLDEPTSGLDSFTAYRVMKILKDIADKLQSTIIFTIHQPSSDVWNLFDRVFFLVEGQFIYQGPRENAIDYFSQMGFQCPIHNNPPDYFMQVISKHSDKYNFMWDNYKQYSAKNDQYLNQVVKKDQYLKNQKIQNILNELDSIDTMTTQFDEEPNLQPTKLNLPKKLIQKGFFEMTKILIGRQFLNLKRHRIMIKARTTQVIIIGILNVLLYFQIDNDLSDYKAINQRCIVFYLIAIGMINQSMNPQVISFSQERPIFLKEQGSGMYSTLSYYISKAIPETFTGCLFGIVFSLIFYWAIGFRNEAPNVIFFIFLEVLLSNVGNAMGLLIGSIFKNDKLSITMTTIFCIPILLFGGVIKNRADYASWIGWIEYINPTFYAFNAFIENEYRGLPYQYSPFEMFHLDFGKWESVGMLFVLYFSFHILAVLCLSRHTKKKLQ